MARATLRRFEGSRYTTKHGKGVHDKDGTGPRRLNQSTETKSPTKNHKQIRNAQAIIHWGSSCGGRVEMVLWLAVDACREARGRAEVESRVETCVAECVHGWKGDETR